MRIGSGALKLPPGSTTQHLNQPPPLPRIRSTPPRPPIRKLILRKPRFPAQLHQADAAQYLAIEHRRPLQRRVWLGVIRKLALGFFVFLVFDGVALFADWNVRRDDEAAAFEKVGAVLGTGFPFLPVEIVLEEIIDCFVRDAPPPLLDSEGLIVVASAEMAFDVRIVSGSRPVKGRLQNFLQPFQLLSDANVL